MSPVFYHNFQTTLTYNLDQSYQNFLLALLNFLILSSFFPRYLNCSLRVKPVWGKHRLIRRKVLTVGIITYTDRLPFALGCVTSRLVRKSKVVLSLERRTLKMVCYAKVASVNYEIIITKKLIFTSGLPLPMKRGKE